ncbi:MAG: endolytic transglycosylase MltG [Clostridia bacterium]|nr:endolytic transglycosylase MltG [Clostridia bacterium]
MNENEKDKLINSPPDDGDELMEETIVFKREPEVRQKPKAPSQNAQQPVRNPAQRPVSTQHVPADLQHTARIQGGAVVRPLKKPSANPSSNPQQNVPRTSALPSQTGRPSTQQRPTAQQPTQQPMAQRPTGQQTQRPTGQPAAQQPRSNPRPANVQQRPVTPSTQQSTPRTNLPAAMTHTRTEFDDFEIESTDARKRNKKSKSDRAAYLHDSATSAVMSLVKAVVYIVCIIAVSIPLAIFIINTANDIFAFVKEEKIVEVTIPEYATMDDVAEILHEEGVIEYPWAFVLWGNLKDENANFVAGTYEVSTTLNYDYLRAAFKKSYSREVVRLTIPEGYTVDEIIDLFVSNGIGTREGFVDVINNYDFEYEFLEGLEMTEGRIYRLEGYLFPDTYDFYKDSSEVTAIAKLLDNFDRKFVDEYYIRCEQLGMTVDEVITLASMVEKEARYADDLGDVSSVFHNRLKVPATFPYLNCDATIMYAIHHDTGDRLSTMTGGDIEYETPYNTYKYKGLPPSAIANPGLNSIKYALYPNDTKYFYFVSDTEGHMLFATTDAEHQKNIIAARSQ